MIIKPFEIPNEKSPQKMSENDKKSIHSKCLSPILSLTSNNQSSQLLTTEAKSPTNKKLLKILENHQKLLFVSYGVLERASLTRKGKQTWKER